MKVSTLSQDLTSCWEDNYLPVNVYVTDGPSVSLNNRRWDDISSGASYESYYYCWQAGYWSCQNGKRSIEPLKMFVQQGEEYEIYMTIGSGLFNRGYYGGYFSSICFNVSIGEFSLDPWNYVVFDAGGHGSISAYGSEWDEIEYKHRYRVCKPEQSSWASYTPSVYPSNGWEFVRWNCDESCNDPSWPITALYAPRAYGVGEAFEHGQWTQSSSDYVKGYIASTNSDEVLPYVVLTSSPNTNDWAELVVSNAFKITFDWKVSSEKSRRGYWYDYLALYVDGVLTNRIAGEVGWTSVTNEIVGTGEHRLRWAYHKDNETDDGDDCGWVARVHVTPQVTLRFVGVGGETGYPPAAIPIYTNEFAILPECGSYKLAYHTFAGWSDGTQTYQPGDEYPGDASVLALTPIWEAKRLAAPVIVAPDLFERDETNVFITAEDGAEIHYTIDGSDPTAESPVYEDFITIGETATIKAMAVRADWFSSAITTAQVVKASYVVEFDVGEHGSIANGDPVQTISYGASANPPAIESDYWYGFSGWDCDVSRIVSNCCVHALYVLRGHELSEIYPHINWKASESAHVVLDESAEDNCAITLTGDVARVQFVVNGYCKISLLAKADQMMSMSFACDDQIVTNEISATDGWTNTVLYTTSPGDHTVSAFGNGRFVDLSVEQARMLSFVGTGDEDGEPPMPLAVYTNETVALPNAGTLKLPKHTFVGWSDGTRVYQPDGLYPDDTDALTLVACWEEKRLAAPAIVAPDVFEADETNVVITADEDAEIHYTTDGSDPTIDSAIYDGPIVLNCSATIKAIAVCEDWYDSPVSEANVEKASYLVVFDAGNHGVISEGDTEQTIIYGGAANSPKVVANDWYEFLRWNCDISRITSNVFVSAVYGQRGYELPEIYPNVDWDGSAGSCVFLDEETIDDCAIVLTGDVASVSFSVCGYNRIVLSAKTERGQSLVFYVDGIAMANVKCDEAWTNLVLHTVGLDNHTIVIQGNGRFADLSLEVARMLSFNGVGGETGALPSPIALYTNEVVTLPDVGSLKLAKHAFTGWSDGTNIYQAGVEYLGNSDVLVLTASWQEKRLSAPVFTTPLTFESDETNVLIAAENGAEIRYTVDGSTPTSESALYAGSLTVYGTTTIRAVAIREDWFDSDIAECTITRGVWTFGEYLGIPNQQFVTGGDANWCRAKGEGSAAGYALKSGTIGNDSTSWLQTTVRGAGTITFRYRVSSEHYKDDVFDWMKFYVDDFNNCRVKDGGETGWRTESVDVLGGGEHLLRWSYEKDEMDEESCGSDCMWLDSVVWTPTDPIPELENDASPQEVAAALDGSADVRLAECITNAVNYNAYRDWAANVKTPDGSGKAGAQAVKESSNAWFSFAVGSDKLIFEMPTSEDVKVDEFIPSSESGKFDFTVSIDGVTVSEEALKENLKQVFGLEGGATLDALSSTNIDISFGTPENGKVKFTAGPNAKNADAKTFFMKVKMTP